MAKIIQAICKFGPTLKLKQTMRLDEVAQWISMRTTLPRAAVLLASMELTDAIKYFNAQGIPVKVDGLGTFSPSIDRHGIVKVNFRADQGLKNDLNLVNGYSGVIANKRNIGLDDKGYKKLWDAEFPHNPLKIDGKNK